MRRRANSQISSENSALSVTNAGRGWTLWSSSLRRESACACQSRNACESASGSPAIRHRAFFLPCCSGSTLAAYRRMESPSIGRQRSASRRLSMMLASGLPNGSGGWETTSFRTLSRRIHSTRVSGLSRRTPHHACGPSRPSLHRLRIRQRSARFGPSERTPGIPDPGEPRPPWHPPRSRFSGT